MKDLRGLRKSNDLTQEDLEKMVGIRSVRLSKYETGALAPTMREMTDLENYFGKPIAWADPLPENVKTALVEKIVTLSARYPLSAVLRRISKEVREETLNYIKP